MSKELENDEGLRVVPEAEVKEMFDGVKKDVAELTAQMTEDREKTGLDIEQRTDDFAKMAENVEAITDRLEKAERASQQNDRQDTQRNRHITLLRITVHCRASPSRLRRELGPGGRSSGITALAHSRPGRSRPPGPRQGCSRAHHPICYGVAGATA